MSFDGLFTYKMVQELRASLLHGKITKIHQPFKEELLFQVRSNGKNHKLLLSAHPTYARMHITREEYTNPSEPPMFCMLLRKHLEGSIIEEITQDEQLDRIVIMRMKSKNEIGDISHKQLIIELMGRHSNIILVDEDKEIILDSVKHLSPMMNRHRTVLPGHAYVSPPQQHKTYPFGLTEDDIVKKIDFNSGKIDRQLVQSFSGISPFFAKEIIHKAGMVNKQTLPKTFMEVMRKVELEKAEPQMITSNHKDSFYFMEVTHITGEKRPFSTLSLLLDRFYYGKAERDRVKQQAADIERFIINERKKNEKKIQKLKNTLDDAEKAEKYKLWGELLTANLYALQRGDLEANVHNYYSEENEVITIPLNVQKTPSENAQAYFQKYQKAKNSVSVVLQQIELAKVEMSYFDTLFQQVESATPEDISEIRDELIEQGYMKAKKQKKGQKKKPQKPTIEVYQATDGTKILVGKNNKQNEYLTNKLASRDDLWFHTKDIPGSHVVIRHAQPSDATILEAAMIAAYFSKAKQSSSVPVDYTKVRHVKKPNGSKPGFVIYEQQQTVYVTPNEDKVIQMKNK